MIALPPIRDHQRKIDPDAELMLRVRDGDRDAFETLVEAYYGRVVGIIEHLMGSRQQSEDLAQDVFLRVYRARENYRPESKFSTWLFVIVNNVVRNSRRSLARRREVHVGGYEPYRRLFLETANDSGPTAGPLDESMRGELRATVRDAIDDLNSRQQTAVLLYHFKGLSYAEVAESMDTTLCAAKALLHRARTSLRRQLNTYVNS